MVIPYVSCLLSFVLSNKATFAATSLTLVHTLIQLFLVLSLSHMPNITLSLIFCVSGNFSKLAFVKVHVWQPYVHIDEKCGQIQKFQQSGFLIQLNNLSQIEVVNCCLESSHQQSLFSNSLCLLLFLSSAHLFSSSCQQLMNNAVVIETISSVNLR